MVVVLPWHDPMRVAEQVAMLDNLADGRLILGLGRGLGKVEFDGFRVPMDESRGRFVEAAEMVLDGLETGYVEYEGTFFTQPEREIRPRPFKSFRGRTYAAAVSPESSRIMAELGVGILIIPQKPWDAMVAELDTYRERLPGGERRGRSAADLGRLGVLRRGRRPGRGAGAQYIGGYYQTVLDHYQLSGDHLGTTKGYEYYGKMAQALNEYGDRHGHRLLRRPAGLGHAGAVLRQDHGHPLDGRQRLVRDGRARTPACRPTRRSATCGCSPARSCPRLRSAG